MIDEDILIKHGANIRSYKKGTIVFEEGGSPRFYFQIKTGCVKMVSSTIKGKEFVQGIFNEGECFGEPPLFVDNDYPSSAVVCENASIYKISKEAFFKIIDDYPNLARKLLNCFAQRIYSKASATQILISHTPEDRILKFFSNLKKESSVSNDYLIPYTRQQIADRVGLRVETVIRSLIKLNEEKKVKIIEHKVYI